MLALDPRWLVGVMTLGIMCVGPDDEVRVDIEARFEVRQKLIELLAEGADAAAVAALLELSEAEAGLLLETLADRGALRPLGESPPSLPSRAFAEAVRAAVAGEVVPLSHTAEELLVLPAGLEAPTARRAVRSFIAGVDPPGRRGVYSYLAIWREQSTTGDVPEAGLVEDALARLAELDPGAVHVFDLLRGEVTSIAPEALHELDFAAPHRLGPLLETREPGAWGAAASTSRPPGTRARTCARSARPMRTGPAGGPDRGARGRDGPRGGGRALRLR